MPISLSDLIAGSTNNNYEEFTSSGTWTRPSSNIKVVNFLLIGGGGSGARANSAAYGGGGGGGGEIVYGTLPTTSNLTITIGTGGTAPTSTTVIGVTGNNSQITGGLFDITAYAGTRGYVFYSSYYGQGGTGGTIGAAYVKSTYAGGWQFGSDPASGLGGHYNALRLIYGLTGFTTDAGLITRVGGSGGGQGAYSGVANAGDGGTSPFAKGGVIISSQGGAGGGAGLEAGGNGGSGGTHAQDGGIGAGGGGGTNTAYAGDGGDGYCVIFWNE